MEVSQKKGPLGARCVDKDYVCVFFCLLLRRGGEGGGRVGFCKTGIKYLLPCELTERSDWLSSRQMKHLFGLQRLPVFHHSTRSSDGLLLTASLEQRVR